MEQQQIEQLKNKLLEEKNRIEKELSDFAKKDDAHIKGNWTTKFPQFGTHTSEQDENEDEVEEYVAELPIEHDLELRLRDINSALEKIEKGEYGKCESGGEDIPFERLQANPEAKTCIDHAK